MRIGMLKNFALFIGGALCLMGAAAQPSKPLVIAVRTEPSTLDGQAVIDRNSRVASGNIFESLLERSADGLVVPSLAESYKAVNDTTWRFTLRKNVKFHNGEPFNAQAAAFSVNRITDKGYKTQRASYIQKIKGAQVVDDYTIDVITDGIDAVLPAQMTQLVMVPPKAAKEKSFGVNPVGTGPYKFVRWDRGREIVLTANEDYWREKPSINAFTVRVIPDAQTQLSALQAGEIDLVLDLLPEQAKLTPKFISVPATEFSYIQFNTYMKELADPRVRVALNLAIDKTTLAKAIYQGHGRPMDAQHLSKGMLGYNADLKPYPYDPKRARELLKAAGYPNGFAVTLNAPIGRYLKGEETAEFVAAQLKEVGLKVTLKLHEWNAYRKLGRISGKDANAFDLKYGWNSNEWFDGSRILSHITCKGGSSKLCDKEIDELMAQGIRTLDQAARDQIYQKVWARLNQSPHAIYLLQQNLIYGLSKRLEWQPRLDDEVIVATMRVSE